MKIYAKIVALVIAVLMVACCFVACGDKPDVTTPDPGQSNTNATVKDDLPEGLNFSGEKDNTITCFGRGTEPITQNEMDAPEVTNEEISDAIYYRNRDIEARLGVKIDRIVLESTDNTAAKNAVITDVNSKLRTYDVVALPVSLNTDLTIKGMFYNVINMTNDNGGYLNLDQPWWNRNILDELEMFDSLYILAGDICISETRQGMGMFYNKDMYAEWYPEGEDLYQLVRDGKWTIGKLTDIVSSVWTDGNTNGVIDDGDTVGYKAELQVITSQRSAAMDVWNYAFGIDVTTKDDDGIPQLTYYSERTIDAYKKLQDLYLSTGTLCADTETTGFENGNVMFRYERIVIAEQGYRDLTFKHGVLPLPKYDEDQEEYGGGFVNLASVVAVEATCVQPEMISAVLELMACGSYNTVTPIYTQIVLGLKLSEAPEDAEMFRILLDSLDVSFGFIYDQQIGGIAQNWRNVTNDFAQRYGSSADKYKNNLESLIDKLEDLAFAS